MTSVKITATKIEKFLFFFGDQFRILLIKLMGEKLYDGKHD